MIELETETHVVVRSTARFREMLRDHHIYTIEDINRDRLHDRHLVRFRKDCVVEPYVGWYQGDNLCSMGAFTYSHSPLSAEIKLGRYCSLGGRIAWPGSRHPMQAVSTSTAFYFPRSAQVGAAWRDIGAARPFPKIPNPDRAAPVIGHDVWIGQDSAFSNGVSIGNGCVVGTQALVTKSFGDYSVIGGNPARRLKGRFDDDLSAALAATKWWRLGLDALKGLPVDDPESFVREAERLKDEPDWRPVSLNVWEVTRTFL
ncbi:LbetaH domain-containing protein [Roseomonas elaeocarpi]|uniref:Antibiotic acetyltransferase n=1 Tax=Roseomonas elaeocarpi TaxID=907779 RepID=A0ABV6JLL5_9PROT